MTVSSRFQPVTGAFTAKYIYRNLAIIIIGCVATEALSQLVDYTFSDKKQRSAIIFWPII